ncbi:MAG: ABC transporter permease [Vicinamibacteria bacterium]|nr:ABC transporter permease [Vicinamibacteria bacterium]
MRNLKLAFRTLFRTPFVTVVAVVSLALGIGATAAIFSLFNQMLLRPLPVRAPEQLVNLSAAGPKPGSQSCNQAGECDEVFSYQMFRDLEKVQTVFTGLAAHRIFGANLAYKGQTLSGSGMLVSGSYFPLLGMQPALGRMLGPGDDRVIGESRVVVLSFNYWQKRFGLNPAVLNDALIVNGQSLAIVGVAPRGFEGTTLGAQPEVFVPITLRALMEPGFEGFDNRRTYWAYVFGRLKPGISMEQAKAGINAPYKAIINDVEAPLQTGMSEQTMKRFRTRELGVTPGMRGQSYVGKEARGPLTLLLGVTGLVLLIACANIANLLLARAASRASEMAVRLALGASRWQLIVQLLTESLVLAVLGGAAGLLVARWTLDLIVSILPDDASQMVQLSLDVDVLLFAAALTVGTGLLFGLFPAIHSTRPDLAPVLKGQSGKTTGTKAAARFRTSLATTQIALSMALLVAAGLFTRSLFNISRVDLGLKIDNLVTFGISPELNGYTPERSLVLFQRIEDELSAVPGVTAVTSSLVPALAGDNWGSSVQVQGFKSGPDIDTHARYNEVSPGYFKTMGVPLISGREFTRADNLKASKVAIVNEEFASKFNLGREAVGKLIGSGEDDKLDTEIVGLVQNAKYSQVKEKIPPLFFRPYAQDDGVGSVSVYVRTALDPEGFLATLPRVVAQIDPNLPLENLRTMQQQVRENVFMDRFISLLSAAFACLATLLAAIGLYGVLAYTVAQRTREIGLRMALGAAPSRVRGMVLRQVAVMTLVGGAIGLGGAVWLARLAESLLYELKGHDPVVLVGAAAVLSIVAMIAGFIPAHRASKVEPMSALRYE